MRAGSWRRSLVAMGLRAGCSSAATWQSDHDLYIRIIHAATGELIRHLTRNPNRTYQPTGAKRGGPSRTDDERLITQARTPGVVRVALREGTVFERAA
jgi:hypothetical protein